MANRKTDTTAMMQPRYTGIPTFMRVPMVGDWDAVDIGLIGVPYDGGVTNRAGARHGPREIRNQSSLMRTYHHVTRVSPYDLVSVADLGDVLFKHLLEHPKALDEIETVFAKIKAHNIIPLSAGGDHTISLPILRALAKDGPVGMIHIDAHTDTWDMFQGSKFSHGSPFRNATEEGLLDPKRVIQIGIRGAQTTADGWDFSEKSGMRVVYMEEFAEIGVPAVIKEARRVVGDGPVYLSFDVDGLDPIYTPGTGTPEIGGITTLEAQQLLRGLRHLNYMGADVVEVAPPFDPTGNTALVAATLMYEILCLIAEKIAAGR
nr:agmatinase [uncultured Dongia sp.]